MYSQQYRVEIIKDLRHYLKVHRPVSLLQSNLLKCRVEGSVQLMADVSQQTSDQNRPNNAVLFEPGWIYSVKYGRELQAGEQRRAEG